MKKILLTLLCLLAVGVSAMAEDYKVSFTAKGTGDGKAEKVIVK